MGEVIIGPWPDHGHPNLSKLMIAQQLGVSTRTVERYMKIGMPHERTEGGYARFHLATVRAWLDGREERVS